MRKHDGVTLVELLVALTVFAVVMGGISVVFISSLKAYQSGQRNISIFETARGALTFMQRDLSPAYMSLDTGHVETLVGQRDWLTFVGLTQNPPTAYRAGYEPEPHTDLSRISYYLTHDPEGLNDMLLIRLVGIDRDNLVNPMTNLVPDLRDAPGESRVYFNALKLAGQFDSLAGANVDNLAEDDFELAENVEDLTFRYGDIDKNGTFRWSGPDDTDPSGDGLDNDGDGEVDELFEGWDSRIMGRLPEVVEVTIVVRAAGKLSGVETTKRTFRTTLFLPLGYQRPRPAY